LFWMYTKSMKKLIGLSLILGSLLVACPTPPYVPTLTNEANTPFYDAINTKRQSASGGTPINCAASGSQFPAKNFTTPSPNLVLDTQLQKAAHNHADFMAKNHKTAMPSDPHNGAGDGTVLTRAKAAGFNGSSLGEIMAFEFTETSAVITAWINSTVGHCQVFMDTDFNRYGAAIVTIPDNNKKYWVVSFGKL
jgi:hypothetical protein